MGGTSCDVAVIDDGVVRQSSEQEIGGRALQLPMVDIHTVGAGGGSIAWADAGGALRVGPRSAGAVPGPASYGRGGREPTVTDANLLLGYLGPEAPLAGGVRLDPEAARTAVGTLARRARPGGPRRRGRDRARRGRGDAARAARRDGAARRRPARLRAGRFRRRRPDACRAAGRAAGRRRVLCPPAAGLLSALGARDGRQAARHGAQPALGRGGDRTGTCRRDARARRSGARRLPDARLEADYDMRYRGPVIRAGGDRRAGCRRGRAARDCSSRRTSTATAIATRTARVELVNVRVSAIEERAPAAVPSAPGRRWSAASAGRCSTAARSTPRSCVARPYRARGAPARPSGSSRRRRPSCRRGGQARSTSTAPWSWSAA